MPGRELALVRPRPLPPGGRVGVCAPAGPVDASRLAAGVAKLEASGFRVCCAEHLHERHAYLAGSDHDRVHDLRTLVLDPEVDAIWIARGGYGLPRILRELDPAEFRRARKLVIGYSDVTALALFLYECAGLASIHGPMLERSDLGDEARARALALAGGSGAELEPLCGCVLRAGRAEGRLVGGNLKLLAASLGTPWEVDARGAILFLEEVGEQPYAIDRSLVQLRDAGKLEGVAGVAIGQLVNCESERYPERTAREVIEELVQSEVGGPVVSDLPFGHVADNRALGFGQRALLEHGVLRLLEPVVEASGGS